MLKQAGKYSVLAAMVTTLTVAASIGCGQAPEYEAPDAPGTGSGSNVPPDLGYQIPAGLIPSDEYDFKVTGQSMAIHDQTNGPLLVSTDTQLLIAIEAGMGQPLGGFTIGFNCEWFRVRVNGVTRGALAKKDGYPPIWGYDACATAPTTWASDFSAAVTPGHAPLKIEIDRAQYDNCAGYRPDGPGYIAVNHGGCMPHAVHSTHGITGHIKIYTN